MMSLNEFSIRQTVDAREKGYRKLCQICKDLCIILGFKALSF